MIYGVKSKLYKRYLQTFDTYSDARVYALKQRQVWTNATMQIWEHVEPGVDRLLEELPPTKGTNYMKIKKKDIRGKMNLTVSAKKIAPKDDEFYGESEAEVGLRLEKELKKAGIVKKHTIAVDFDGVIHKYSKGYHDGTAYDVPMEGAIVGLKKLMEKYTVYVFTARDCQEVQNWFGVHTDLGTEIIRDNRPFYENQHLIGISNRKLPAIYYIDDRALYFRDWKLTLQKIFERGEDGDLVSNCCARDFDPLGYEKEEGIWQERCLGCGKLCEPLWLSLSVIRNIQKLKDMV